MAPRSSCVLEHLTFRENVNTDVLYQLQEAGLLRNTQEDWKMHPHRLPEETHLIKWAKKIINKYKSKLLNFWVRTMVAANMAILLLAKRKKYDML